MFSTPEVTDPTVELTGMEDVAIGDVTGDGKDDVVALALNRAAGFQDIVVLPGSGTDSLGQPIRTPVAGDVSFGPRSVSIGNLNGDAAKDIVLATIGVDGGTVNGNFVTMLADGGGGFNTQTTLPAMGLAQQVDFLDANGDAHEDVAVGFAFPKQVAIGLGDGAGNLLFPPALKFPISDEARNSMSVGDINGGADDIVVGAHDTIDVLLSGPGGTYTHSVLPSANRNHCATAIGDYNSDGLGDVFDSFCSLPPLLGDAEAFAGNGAGGFAPLASVRADGDVYGAATGDFDLPADGREDVMVVNTGVRDDFPDNGRFPSLVNWIRNGENGLQVRPVTERDSPPEPGPGGDIAVGQLNGDGVPDFAVVTYFDLTVFRSFDDVVPPDTSVVGGAGGNGRVLAAKPKKNNVRFKANEAGSAFKCKLDKRKAKPCRSPYKARKLKAGKHVLKIRAADLAGNRERKPAKVRIKIRRR
jgi:hypothetical protein